MINNNKNKSIAAGAGAELDTAVTGLSIRLLKVTLNSFDLINGRSET